MMVKQPLKNHIVICGWSETTQAIVSQLHSEDVAEQRHVVIIDDKVSECPIDDPYVYFVHGDPTEDATLERAGIPTASTAIILADWSLADPNLRDSKTALVTLAIESMCPEVYTCAELMKSESKRHLKRADVDEPICVSDLSQRMLVMAALNHGLSRLFDDLLTFNEGSEIYCVPVPTAYVGRTFREAVSDLSTEREIIVMSVRRGNEVFTNPEGEFLLQEDDRLFVLAERYPEGIEHFEAPKARKPVP
jgi:voltage-gated potassium channel